MISEYLERRKRFFLSFLLLTISVLLLSCGKKEEEIIPEEKFMIIYFDVLKAQDSLGTSAMFMKPALEEILKRNGVSRKLYDKTVDFYMKNPEDYKELLVLMEEKLVSLKDSVSTKP
ncbi:hypothetical protein MASR2M39_02680 [Ignavibacteriales bacterium]